MRQKLVTLLVALLTIAVSLQAQEAPRNWQHLDYNKDKSYGVSSNEAYQTLLKGKKAKQTVIVAVIDSGIDAAHEDLNAIIWVNEDEIAGNGIDDDGNGYVDDIHGWNFIGGKDGRHVDRDTYEMVRELRKLRPKFQDMKPSRVTAENREAYDYYQSLEVAYQEEVSNAEEQLENINYFVQLLKPAMATLKEHLQVEEITEENLASVDVSQPQLLQAVNIVNVLFQNNLTENELLEVLDHFEAAVKYQLNMDFDPREIVGDNYEDVNEHFYGNSDSYGPHADHGTHVAGIIAAIRDNDLGAVGISDAVRIMPIRTVPDGDERDKDVANAIRYAVDNGAKIINMSFGKSYSPYKEAVDEAIRYAAKNNVLMVHAAGNDGKNIDEVPNFPTKYLNDGTIAENWIEVGANTWNDDERLVANFSNYGQETVDVFAPGVEIYSTLPEGKYQNQQGTSMASPVVAGVAAVLLAHYPTLSAVQVKDIIKDSATKIMMAVIKPGTEADLVGFNELSNTGGIVNLYEALRLASEVAGENK